MKMGDLVRVRSWSCLIWTLNLNLLHKEGVGVRGGGGSKAPCLNLSIVFLLGEKREKRETIAHH